MMKINYLLSHLALIVLTASFVCSVAMAEDEQLEKYKQIWAAIRPKSQSGIIHYKQFTSADLEIREHDKVRSLFQELSKDRENYP
jgi:hypothetical protein